MEKLSDGRTLMRSEAAERTAACQHELQCQHRVDILSSKLQQEIEQESSGIVYFCLLTLTLLCDTFWNCVITFRFILLLS